VSSGSSSVSRVSPGIVLITVGTIVLAAVAAIYLLSPMTAPPDLIEVAVRVLPASMREALPGLEPEGRQSGEQADGPGASSLAVLLPGPADDAASGDVEPGLPSVASVDEAPRFLGNNAPDQPTRLIIPNLGVDSPVRPVGLVPVERNGQRFLQWEVPNDYHVGWHTSSAPLGQPGNTVLNGHNNIHGEVFRDLIKIEAGHRIIVYDNVRAYEYVVQKKVLLQENGQPISARLMNARWIEPTFDERLTLVSCWPYATNDHRLVVVAMPLDGQASQ
jgi:LPXTG-site transpeptidase (sortase) family protein